jgi:hypothetical protein
MADATRDRSAVPQPEVLNLGVMGPFGLAAAYKVPAGVAQNLDSSGRLKSPASTTEVVAGVTHEAYDNTSGSNDAVKAALYRGPHKFALHATHPPTAADIGQMGYFSDNQTVSRLASDGTPGGKIEMVESDGVVVNVGWMPISSSAAGITALTDNSGGAAADGTIGAVAATAAATAGGATPTAAQVDTGIATAVASVVTGTNAAIKELATKVNEIIAALK